MDDEFDLVVKFLDTEFSKLEEYELRKRSDRHLQFSFFIENAFYKVDVTDKLWVRSGGFDYGIREVDLTVPLHRYKDLVKIFTQTEPWWVIMKQLQTFE